MNEQAVKDSYELFKTGGYAKSFDEFVELINTNPQALQDSYDLFQTGGYSKSMDDYQALMGLKKKDEAMDSSLGDGSLEPSVQEATETPDFSQSLTAVTPGLIAQEEEQVVPDMRGQFGKYGFAFNETGIGDAMTVTTTDGSASIDVDLDTFTDAGAEEESQRLRQFMNANATAPVELETDNLLDQAYRAQNIRGKAMRNNDGSESTVEFMSYEQDGKYKVAPTLFPINPDNYNSDGRTWMRLGTDEAIQTAERRGEVFTFDTEEEANAFAEGNWKDVAPVEIEAQHFYREKNRDYVSDRASLQEYEALRDERIFLEDSDNAELESLTEEEKALYSQHYTNGVLREDVEGYVNSIEQREDTLFDAVMDDDAMTAREDFDVYLNERQNNIAGKAAQINQSARAEEATIQKNSMASFGIPVEELVNYEPKNDRERDYANNLITQFNAAKQSQELAGFKYDQAKTYFDAKHDEKVYAEFTENLQGFTDGVENAWNSGWAAEAMLAYEMSGKMPENQQEAAAIISERMSNMKPGQSRAMSRIDNSVGVKEWWDAFSDDPLEITSNYVASSLSMLLPLGIKIIPAAVATGAATGAAIAGAAGAAASAPVAGAAAPVTAAAGALIGAGKGFLAGQAAAGAALEYTNAILDSMREGGYNISDPSQVLEALNNEEVMAEGRRVGAIRGVTIGAFNIVGGAAAGRMLSTSGLASTLTRSATQLAERMIFDPVVEGTGELAAQVFSGQEINWKEIAAESIGGVGNNAPNAFINIYSQTRNRTDLSVAHQLTDINYIAGEKASDQRINDWATNMRKLGKIDAETEQRILENVGARRDALKTLGVGPKRSRTSSPEVVSRLMALEEAKKQLSSANKEAFSSEISQINKEIGQIGLTKKIVKDGVKIDDLVPELLRKPDVPLYKVGKKFMTRTEFLEHITDMTPQQKAKLEKQGYAVRNDVEVVELVKQTLEPDAVQEQSPGDISENQSSTDIQEVEEEVSRQQEPTPEEVETLEGEVSDLESELGLGIAPVEEAAPEVDSVAAQSARYAQLLEDTPDSVLELFENWTKSLFSPEIQAIENKEPFDRTRSESAKLAAVTRRMKKALAAAEAAGLDNSAQVELTRAVNERLENQEAAPEVAETVSEPTQEVAVVEAAPVAEEVAVEEAAPVEERTPDEQKKIQTFVDIIDSKTIDAFKREKYKKILKDKYGYDYDDPSAPVEEAAPVAEEAAVEEAAPVEEDGVLYHVTFSKNAKGIKKNGLVKGRPGTFSRKTGGKFDTADKTYAFSSLKQASQFGIITKFEFPDSKISIIAIKKGTKVFEKDPSLIAAESAVFTKDAVGPNDILSVKDVAEFKGGKAIDKNGKAITEESFSVKSEAAPVAKPKKAAPKKKAAPVEEAAPALTERDKRRKSLVAAGYTFETVKEIYNAIIYNRPQQNNTRAIVNALRKIKSDGNVTDSSIINYSLGGNVRLFLSDGSDNIINDIWQNLLDGEVSLEEFNAFAKKFNVALPEAAPAVEAAPALTERDKRRKSLKSAGYTYQVVEDIVTGAIFSSNSGSAGVRKLTNAFKKIKSDSNVPMSYDFNYSGGGTVGSAMSDASELISGEVYQVLLDGEITLEEFKAFAKKFNQPLPEAAPVEAVPKKKVTYTVREGESVQDAIRREKALEDQRKTKKAVKESEVKRKKGESDKSYYGRVSAASKAKVARIEKEKREAAEREKTKKEALGKPKETAMSPSEVAKAKAEQKIKDEVPSFDPLDYDDRVVEIEEEIAIEKGNTTEKIASVKKEAAKVRANKKLSAAKKKEKIAELKEELDEFKEDQSDLIDSYRDDIKEVKAEKKSDEKEFNKAKKDAEKKGVRFRLQDEQDQIEEYDVDAIVDEMNELGPAQMEFTTPTASQKGLEVNPIEESKSSVKITEEQAKELGFESVADMLKTIETFNGIPMLPAMSDMLASGKTKDSEGKSMRLDGGLLFNILGSNKDLAWAGVTKEGAQEMYDNAVKLYESNKDLFESLWEEGRLPNGHIPLMVLRMGNPSVNSNEAVFRFILPTIKKGENQEQAMTLLSESVESKTKVDNKAVRRDAASLKAFIEKKNITTVSQLLQEVIKDIKKRAKGDYKNTLPLSARGLLYDVMFSAEGAVTNSRPYAKTLFPGNKEVLQKLTSNFIYKGIGEPSMLKSKQGEGVAVMGVDVLNGGVRKADHNNYGFGPKGRVIALIKNPKHGIDMFAEWAAKAPRIFKLTKPKKGGPEKLPSQEDVVRQTGGAFFTDAAFRGAKVLGEQISDLNLLIGKLRFAFPSVSVATTKKEFDAIVSRPGVKTRKIEGKTILGITMEGKVWINPEAASLATPIHEFGHIWVDYLRSKDSGKKGDVLLAKGFELVKGTKAYESAKRKYGDTELALEEALVELIATKGETIVNAAQKSRFKSWLNAMYEFIKEKFIRSADIKTKDVQDMTLDSFVNTALADLFGGVAVSSTFDPASISEAARARYETVDAESKGLAESIRMIPNDSSISMTDIIQYGRSKGYSDASIRELLKRQGYDVKTINDGIIEYTEPSIIVPAVFGNVKGGMDTGKAIYQSVVQQLNEFAEVTQENKTKKTAKEIRQKAMAILRENEAFNEQSPSTQRELLVAMNDSLSVATNKDVSREMKQLRNDIRQGKAAIKNLKEYQTRLRRLIRQEMNQTGIISRSRVNRLLASVANTTEKNFYAQAQKVLNTIDEQREAEKKLVINDLIKYTKKQAKKAKTASGRTRTRGLDAVGQLYFETLTRVLTIAASPNKQMRMSAIANLQQKLNESDVLQSAMVKVKNNRNEANEKQELTLPEEKALDQSIALDAWGSIADMTLEEVRASVAIIKSEATASRALLNEKRVNEKNLIEDLEVEAVAEVKKLAPILFDEEGNPLSKEEVMRQRTNILKQYKEGSFKEKFEAVKQYVSTMQYSELMKSARSNFDIVKHLGTLMNQMGPWFKENVYDRLNVSRRNYLQGLDDQRAKMDEIANSVKGITKGYKEMERVIYSPLKEDIAELTIQGKKYQFNKSQLMWLYSLSKNDVQREMLEKQGVPIEKIEEFLGPQLIDFADKMVTYLSQDYFESINKVYKDVSNINLTQIENYFPTRKISDESMPEIIKGGEFSQVFNAMYDTALKERTAVKGEIPLQSFNFTDLLENHFDAMERFKAFAYTTRDLNKIFSFPAVVTLMDSLGIKNLVKQHINHAINPASVQGDVVGPKAIAWFQRKFVGSILGLKMAQMWKQASSFVASFEQYEAFPGYPSFKVGKVDVKPGKEVVEFTAFLLDAAKMYAFDLPVDIIRMAQGKESAGPLSLARSISPEFRDRLKKSLRNDIAGLAGGQTPTYTEQQRYKALSRTRRVLRSAVGAFTSMGDLLGVLGYMVTYKRNIKNGMSPEKAAIKFDDYNATQQSKRETERNQLQQSRNVFMRMFTMFGSATFLLMNNVMQSTKNIGRSVSKGETPKRTDIRKLYLNLGLVNAVFYGTAYAAKLAGSNSDKDEWLKRVKDSLFGLNLVYSVPLLGAAAETASEFIQEGKVPRMSSGGGIDPISSALTNTLRNISNSKLDTYEQLVPMASLLVGANLEPIVALGEMASGTNIDGDEIYEVMGIPKSQRPS